MSLIERVKVRKNCKESGYSTNNPSQVSIPPNQNGESVFRKIHSSKQCYEVAFVFRWLEFAFGRLGVIIAQAS